MVVLLRTGSIARRGRGVFVGGAMRALVVPLAGCLVALASPASAQSFSQFYGFGDSTIEIIFKHEISPSVILSIHQEFHSVSRNIIPPISAQWLGDGSHR